MPAPGVETPSEPGKPGLEPQPGSAESAGDKAWGGRDGWSEGEEKVLSLEEGSEDSSSLG